MGRLPSLEKASVLALMQRKPLDELEENSPEKRLQEEYGDEPSEKEVWNLFLKRKRAGAFLSESLRDNNYSELMKRAKFRRESEREES